MKVLGIEITKGGNTGPCSGRPGVLQQMHEGEWVSIVRNKDGSPVVCQCEHEALEQLSDVMDAHMQIIKEHVSQKDMTISDAKAFTKDHLPRPEEFRYQFVDEDITDVEVKDTKDAQAVLAKVMGGAS